MENGKKKSLDNQSKWSLFGGAEKRILIVRPPTGVGGILTRLSGRKYILC